VQVVGQNRHCIHVHGAPRLHRAKRRPEGVDSLNQKARTSPFG
jgi:hypothetical protein